jgi:hypothetical protein
VGSVGGNYQTDLPRQADGGISRPDVTGGIGKEKPDPGMRAEDSLDAKLNSLLGYIAICRRGTQ